MAEQTPNPNPVAEVLTNPSHPLNTKVADVIGKLESGQLSMCACTGPICGEPYCPCEMRNRGLPPSPVREAADAEATQKLGALVRSGIFSGT